MGSHVSKRKTRKGEKVLAYESDVTPNDPKFVKDIERLLAQP